jgi:hypothetical protein
MRQPTSGWTESGDDRWPELLDLAEAPSGSRERFSEMQRRAFLMNEQRGL